MHMPVLNALETIVSVPIIEAGNSEIDSPWSSLDVVSPSIPMPKANFSTVCNRLQKWSVLNGTGRAGQCIDPRNVIAAPLAAAPGKMLMMGKDSLGMNNNIEGAYAVAAIASVGTDAEHSFMAINCLAHGVVLAMKPTMERIDGAPMTAVRLGHRYASTKFATNMMETVVNVGKTC